MDDVALNKAAAIERSVGRVREVFADDERNLRDDFTKQDSIILNLQRACESAIDLAMHMVRRGRLGVPQESRDAFVLLKERAGLDEGLADSLKRMVGFRNVAVHDYRALSLDIVSHIARTRLDDLVAFSKWALRSTENDGSP